MGLNKIKSNRITRKKNKRKGGTKSCLKKSGNSSCKKNVSWDPKLEPQKQLRKTRSQTKKHNEEGSSK